MSLVINNAYKIEAASLDEAYAKLEKLKKPLDKMAQKLFAENVLNQAFRKYCLFTWPKIGVGAKFETTSERKNQKNPEQGHFLLKVMRDINEMSIKYAEDNLPTNTECNIVLIPHKGEYFAIFFCGNRVLNKELNKISKSLDITDYSYWNNSDPDEEVSDKDWAKREKIWENIFDKNQSPIEVGLNVLICKNMERSYIQIQDILKHNSSLTEDYKKHIKTDYFIEVLLNACIKDKTLNKLYKAEPYTMYGILEKVINNRMQHIGTYKKEAEIALPFWEQIKEDFKHYEFAYPKQTDLNTTYEQMKILQDKNTLSLKNQQEKTFTPPKL